MAPLLNKVPATRRPSLQHLPDGSSLQRPCQQLRHGVPASNIFPIVLCRSAPGQQCLPDGAPLQSPGRQQASSVPPASNKPHQAEKSTPVWLAIWRTGARFANSQLRRATFLSLYLYMCLSPLLPPWAAAQTDANLSAHLHRWPTPPPYLRPMRLLPGQGAGIGC